MDVAAIYCSKGILKIWPELGVTADVIEESVTSLWQFYKSCIEERRGENKQDFLKISAIESKLKVIL